MYLSSSTRVVRLIESNIIEIIYFDNAVVTQETVQSDFDLLQSNLPEGKYKKLIISGKNGTSTISSRKLQAKLNHSVQKNILAEALVAHNSFQRAVVTVYILFNQADYPKRCFNSAEEAKKWLKKIK